MRKLGIIDFLAGAKPEHGSPKGSRPVNSDRGLASINEQYPLQGMVVYPQLVSPRRGIGGYGLGGIRTPGLYNANVAIYQTDLPAHAVELL